MNDAAKVLEQYALDNYEAGGHWVVECWLEEDYLQALTEGGSIEGAKKVIKAYWELVVDQERNCSWD